MLTQIKTKVELEKKYHPLEIPQILLNLIERRIHGNGENFTNPISILVVIVSFIVALIIELLIFKAIMGLFSIVILPLIFLYHAFDDNRKAANETIKQIELRSIPDKQEYDILWEDIEKVEIANQINLICIEQIGWEKGTLFLPDDPFCLMIELYTGDLCEVEAIMAIEEVFSLEFPESFYEEKNPGDMKFKDIVGYILNNN